jgi:MFS family permease
MMDTPAGAESAGVSVTADGRQRKSSLRDIPAGVWALGFVSMSMDISSEMIHSLLPVYLISVLGASALTVGFIEGIAEATSQIVKIFSGALSDLLGKRKALAAFGYGLSACTKPIFPLVSAVGWVVAARFIDRVGKGIRGAPRDALIADLTPPQVRGASFGLRQSLDTVGAVFGPFIAIAVMWVTADRFTLVFWVAVLPAFVSLGLIIFAVREPAQHEAAKDARAPLKFSELGYLGPACWAVIAIGAVFALARFSDAFLVLRAQSVGLSLVLIPAVFVVMNVVYALSAYPVGALSDRMDRAALLVIGLCVLVIADIVLALAAGIAALAVGVILWGLHLGITQGLLAALVTDTAPANRRGTAFGIFNLVSGVAQLCASVVAGIFWDAFGPGSTFYVGAAVAIVALAVLLPVRRWLRRSAGRPVN